MFLTNLLKLFMVVLGGALIISCGGGERSDPPPQIPSLDISGIISNGEINSAVVKIYDFTKGEKQELLAETTSNGAVYDVTIEDIKVNAKPLLVELTNVEFIDELSGQTINSRNGQSLKSVVTYRSGDRSIFANVNPLTTFASCLSTYRLSKGDGNFEKEVADSYQQIKDIYSNRNFDLLTSEITGSRIEIDQDSRLTSEIFYGYLIASLSLTTEKVIQQNNSDSSGVNEVNSLDLTQVICEDLKSDGILNRYGSNSAEVLEIGGVDLPSNFYRDARGQSLFELLDLNLNGAGFDRLNVLDDANHIISIESDILESDPLSDLYELIRIDNLTDLTDIDLRSCINLQKKVYTSQIKNLTCVNESSSFDIKSLSGLENFKELEFLSFTDVELSSATNLVSLPNLKHLTLRSTRNINLDLTKFPKLINLDVISNLHRGLNIDQAPQLEYLSITTFDGISFDRNVNLKFLNINDSRLSVLDLRNNEKLEHLGLTSPTITQILGVEGLVNIKSFSLEINKNVIDITAFPNLVSLELTNETIEVPQIGLNPGTLDLNLFKKLEHLSLIDIPDLVVVDIKDLNSLTELNVKNINLSNINLVHHPKLENLLIENTLISSLDVSFLRNLKKLEIKNLVDSKEMFAELDLDNPNLYELGIYNASLSGMNLNFIPNVQSLNLRNSFSDSASVKIENLNELEIVFVSNHSGPLSVGNVKEIKNITVRNTNIETLSLNDSLYLESVEVSDNGVLTNIELDQCPMLNQIKIGSNDNLVSVSAENSINLNEVSIGGNALLSDVSLNGSVNVKILGLSFNESLSEINLNDLEQLQSFQADGTSIKEIDLRNNLNLVNVDVLNGSLEEIIFSPNMSITSLDISGNQNLVDDFDFSGLPLLKRLNLNDTNLTRLDLTNSKLLETLHASSADIRERKGQLSSVINVCATRVFLEDNLIEEYIVPSVNTCPNTETQFLILSMNPVALLASENNEQSIPLSDALIMNTFTFNNSDFPLENFSLGENVRVSNLDLRNNNLQMIDLNGNLFVNSLNIIGNPNLNEVVISETNLNSENVSHDDHTELR